MPGLGCTSERASHKKVMESKKVRTRVDLAPKRQNLPAGKILHGKMQHICYEK